MASASPTKYQGQLNYNDSWNTGIILHINKFSSFLYFAFLQIVELLVHMAIVITFIAPILIGKS